MIEKKASAASVAFLIFLFILLGVSLYLLYLNWPKEPVQYTFTNGIEESIIEYSASKQFYDNMRFKDEIIGYKIEKDCDSKKVAEIEEAFDILESKTVLDFKRDSLIPEVTIFCSDIAPEPKNEGYFVAGEGGPTEVINTTLYGIILSGKVSFFREERCAEPKVAIHEILHVLGFDHNDNPDSILFPTLDCNQTIDDSIITDINSLYSAKSLPDLKILQVDATKSGRYLNFEISVLNRGLQDVQRASLKVYSNDKFIKEFDLGQIDIGVTKFLDVTNLNLGIFAKSDTVTFIIDEENEIDEIFENNNRVELILVDE
jgi:hypothetical protein